MGCDLDKLVRRVIDSNPNSAVAKKLLDVLANDATLFSEDATPTQLGDRGAGNNKAYATYKSTIQAEYDRLKGNIGKLDKSINQTIKDVRLDGTKIIVSFNKGPDRIVSNDSLFSEKGETTFTTDVESLREGAMKSTEGLKAIIEELGDVDSTYKEYVVSLIDKIEPKFIPEMQLYITKEADKNLGMIDNNKLIVNVASNMDKSDKTATEVYVHELMHAITKFAIKNSGKNPKAARLVEKLQYMRDEAAKVITVEDLMPEQSLDLEADIKAATELYNYIFSSKNGLDEFIAHGLTNPVFMSQLKKHKLREQRDDALTLFQVIANYWADLVDVVLGNIGFQQVHGSLHKNLMQLTFELMQTNNEAINEVVKNSASEQSYIGNLLEMSNSKLKGLIDKVEEGLGEASENSPMPVRPENATKFENAVWLVKFLPQLLTRRDLNIPGLKEGVLSSLGMKPEGLVQNIMRDVQTPSELERQIEEAEMASGTIDRIRELTVQETRGEVKNAFKEKLTEKEEEALTLSVLDTDLQAIYDRKDIHRLLSDEKHLLSEIKLAKSRLGKLDPDNYFWNSNQATGLGYYLATHNSSLVQNLNASNIAKGYLSGVHREASKELTQQIDELATLEGIKFTPNGSNTIVAELIKKDKEGVDFVVALARGIKSQARSLFDTDAQMIKGYSKELFDDTVEIRVRPVKDKEQMEKEGFVLEKKLKNDPLDLSGHEMAIYKTKYYVNNSYNRAATRMTNTVKRGTSLTDIAFSSNELLAERSAKLAIKKIKRLSIRTANAMSNGEYEIDVDNKLSPVINQDGKIVNYRYTMSKTDKKKLLLQDTKIGEVLGRTLGSVGDKIATDAQNEAVLDIILADMEENYIEDVATGNNAKEYVKIEANSPIPNVSEIYKLLPAHMKQAIKESDKGYIAVRRDMLTNYFGFRDATLTDFFGLHGVTPAVMKRWILTAENLWAQIVSISKVDIIIRTPAVFIGNIISNFMYSVVMGANPLTVGKMQLDNMRNVTTYIHAQKEIERLKVGRVAGRDHSKTIKRMEYELTLNPVHELMEAGMYQAIVEDIDKQDYKSSSKLGRKLDEKLKTTPEFVRDGVNWMYLNEHTSFFKLVTQATQYSDFVARATEYQLLIAKGTNKKVAMQTVLDAFVNYGKPASKFEEYLNSMGLIMFTKYMKRILRTIHKSARTKPVNLLLSVLGQEAFFEVDDIWDQNLFTRSFGNLNQDMFKHIENTFTPTAFQFMGIAD